MVQVAVFYYCGSFAEKQEHEKTVENDGLFVTLERLIPENQ